MLKKLFLGMFFFCHLTLISCAGFAMQEDEETGEGSGSQAGPSAPLSDTQEAVFTDFSQSNRTNKIWPVSGNIEIIISPELRVTLLETAINPDHQEQWMAIVQLLTYDTENQIPNLHFLRPILFDAARNPEHPHRWYAVWCLWGNDSERQYQNRLTLRPLLFEAARNREDPNHWDAIERLWTSDVTNTDQNRVVLRPLLLESAHNQEDPQWWNSISNLWDRDPQNQASNRLDLYPVLLGIAQNPGHIKWEEAVKKLWFSALESQAQDRATLRPLLFDALHSQFNYSQRAVWINLLKMSGPQNKELARLLERCYFLNRVNGEELQRPVDLRGEASEDLLRIFNQFINKELARLLERCYFLNRVQGEALQSPVDLRGEASEDLLRIFNQFILPGNLPSQVLENILPPVQELMRLAAEGRLVCQALAWLEETPSADTVSPPEAAASGGASGIDTSEATSFETPLPLLLARGVVLEQIMLKQRLEAALHGIDLGRRLLGEPVRPQGDAHVLGELDPATNAPLITWRWKPLTPAVHPPRVEMLD